MPQDFSIALCFLAALGALTISPVTAKPAKNRSPVALSAKQEPVRTDLTPRSKNECLTIARTLNDQAKKLSQQTKQSVSREFARVAADLDQSCGAEDYTLAHSAQNQTPVCKDG
jgi:hypothetical protein